jgi:chromosome segregation ATPase
MKLRNSELDELQNTLRLRTQALQTAQEQSSAVVSELSDAKLLIEQLQQQLQQQQLQQQQQQQPQEEYEPTRSTVKAILRDVFNNAQTPVATPIRGMKKKYLMS